MLGGAEIKFHDLTHTDSTGSPVVGGIPMTIGSNSTVPIPWNSDETGSPPHGGIADQSSMVLVNNGNSVNQKIGQKIVLKSIDLRWKFVQPQVSTSGSSVGECMTNLQESTNTVNFLLVVDHSANGANITLGDILFKGGDTTPRIGQGGLPYDMNFRKIESTKRFTIIWKKSFNLPRRPTNMAYSTGGGAFHAGYERVSHGTRSKHKNLNNTLIEYKPSTIIAPTVADLCCNNLFLFAFLNQAKGSFGRQVTMEANARIRFIG